MNSQAIGKAIRLIHTHKLESFSTFIKDVQNSRLSVHNMINVMMAITRSVCVASETTIAINCPICTLKSFL